MRLNTKCKTYVKLYLKELCNIGIMSVDSGVARISERGWGGGVGTLNIWL